MGSHINTITDTHTHTYTQTQTLTHTYTHRHTHTIAHTFSYKQSLATAENCSSNLRPHRHSAHRHRLMIASSTPLPPLIPTIPPPPPPPPPPPTPPPECCVYNSHVELKLNIEVPLLGEKTRVTSQLSLSASYTEKRNTEVPEEIPSEICTVCGRLVSSGAVLTPVHHQTHCQVKITKCLCRQQC